MEEEIKIMESPSGVRIRRIKRTLASEAASRSIAKTARNRGGFLAKGAIVDGPREGCEIGIDDALLRLQSVEGKVTLLANNGRGLALLPLLSKALESEAARVPAFSSVDLFCDRVVLRTRSAEADASSPRQLALIVARLSAAAIGVHGDELFGFYGLLERGRLVSLTELENAADFGESQGEFVLHLADSFALIDPELGLVACHFELAIGVINASTLPREKLVLDADAPAKKSVALRSASLDAVALAG